MPYGMRGRVMTGDHHLPCTTMRSACSRALLHWVMVAAGPGKVSSTHLDDEWIQCYHLCHIID